MNAFILETCCCVIKGTCHRGDKTEVPISIKGCEDTLLRAPSLDIQAILTDSMSIHFS